MPIIETSPELSTPPELSSGIPVPPLPHSVPDFIVSNRYGLRYHEFPIDIMSNAKKYGGNFMVIYINEQVTSGSNNTPNNNIVDRNGLPIILGGKDGITVIKDAPGLPSFFKEGGGGTSSYRGKFGTRINNTTKRSKEIIILNIPESVTSNFGTSYSEISLGLAGSVANGGTNVLEDADDMLLLSGIEAGGALAPKLLNALGTKFAARSPGLQKIFSSIAGGSIFKDAVESAKNLYQLSHGIAINPYQELLFKGVEYRKFSFKFKLFATKKEESRNIDNIINLLKYHMHPSVNSSAARFFTNPSEFDIEFYFNGKENPYLDFLSTCVLDGMSVDYSNGTSFVTHNDGAPAFVEITVNFKELEILTKNRIDELYNMKYQKTIIARTH